MGARRTDCVLETCPSPAWVEWEGTARGADFSGADSLFLMQRVRCGAGHNFTRTLPGVPDPDSPMCTCPYACRKHDRLYDELRKKEDGDGE